MATLMGTLMLGHILLPESLGTEEMVKHQWHVHREAVERPDGRQRWDRAFQSILRWSLENEQAYAPSVSVGANGKEEYHLPLPVGPTAHDAVIPTPQPHATRAL